MSPTISPPFEYRLPTRIVFGDGSLSRLPEVVEDTEARVLVVSIKSMWRLGVLEQVERLLGKDRVVVVDPVPAFPTPDLVDRAVDLFRSEGCTVVVGVGGGSAMDVAKSTAILQAHPHKTRDYLTGQARLEKPGVPYIAVPTTAGTGSEVTPWATIWDTEARRKHSLEHRWMFPAAAIVDPKLTVSLSESQTAVTGMDALTQAVEAYWSRNSQPISDIYALAAVRLIFENLEAACKEGGLGARSAMAHASLLSGLAFSNTKTTICHSLSYPMSAHFDVPHGQAVSVTLPPFLLWNADAISSKLPQLLEAMDATCAEDAAHRVRSLMTSIGIATDLRSLGMTEKDIDLLLKEGFYADRADNNPKPVAIEDARAILQRIL